MAEHFDDANEMMLLSETFHRTVAVDRDGCASPHNREDNKGIAVDLDRFDSFVDGTVAL